MSDGVQQYKALLSRLLDKRSLGPLSVEDEATLADERAELWRRLSDTERLEVEPWINGQLTVLRKSAVSWVEQNGLVLVVWNKRFHGWAMPGGMVEDGESLERAQARELLEETGLGTHSATLVFRRELKLPPPKQDRSSDVHFFRVVAYGVPRGMEDDCPISWLSWDALCTVSPFREFYIAARADQASKVPPG